MLHSFIMVLSKTLFSKMWLYDCIYQDILLHQAEESHSLVLNLLLRLNSYIVTWKNQYKKLESSKCCIGILIFVVCCATWILNYCGSLGRIKTADYIGKTYWNWNVKSLNVWTQYVRLQQQWVGGKVKRHIALLGLLGLIKWCVVLSYGDLFHGFLDVGYSELIYHSLLLGVLCSFSSPRAIQAGCSPREHSWDSSSQMHGKGLTWHNTDVNYGEVTYEITAGCLIWKMIPYSCRLRKGETKQTR